MDLETQRETHKSTLLNLRYHLPYCMGCAQLYNAKLLTLHFQHELLFHEDYNDCHIFATLIIQITVCYYSELCSAITSSSKVQLLLIKV